MYLFRRSSKFFIQQLFPVIHNPFRGTGILRIQKELLPVFIRVHNRGRSIQDLGKGELDIIGLYAIDRIAGRIFCRDRRIVDIPPFGNIPGAGTVMDGQRVGDCLITAIPQGEIFDLRRAQGYVLRSSVSRNSSLWMTNDAFFISVISEVGSYRVLVYFLSRPIVPLTL